MKCLQLLLAASVLASATPQKRANCKDIRDAPITRDGPTLLLNGKPWKAVGPNVYWLGLDENVTPPPGEPYYAPFKASYPTKGRITEAMAVVKAMGGTSIRAHTLGVSTGNPLSVMPELGKVNEKAFETIDWAVYQAREFGLRLMVPLTDNYDYYHGGKYNFLRWAGFNLTQAKDANNPQIQQFYTDQIIVASFKDYIKKLVTHVNPYTNLTYAEDPTIWAYETGNELLGPVWGDMNCPAAWVADIGKFVKTLAPNKLFVDGTYGVNKEHLGIQEVDVFSNHYYPASLKKLRSDLDLVASVNKPYFAGEYDWNLPAVGADPLPAWFKELETSKYVAGDAFWSQFGRNIPNCNEFVQHADGFTLHYGDPANSATVDSRVKLIRKHFIKESQGVDIAADAELPVVPCPVPAPGSKGEGLT